MTDKNTATPMSPMDIAIASVDALGNPEGKAADFWYAINVTEQKGLLNIHVRISIIPESAIPENNVMELHFDLADPEPGRLLTENGFSLCMADSDGYMPQAKEDAHHGDIRSNVAKTLFRHGPGIPLNLPEGTKDTLYRKFTSLMEPENAILRHGTDPSRRTRAALLCKKYANAILWLENMGEGA